MLSSRLQKSLKIARCVSTSSHSLHPQPLPSTAAWRAFEVVEGWPARPLPHPASGGGGPTLDGVGDCEGVGELPGISEDVGDGLLLVPKRRQSYSRKRHRQSNPLYREHETSHIYPCPKCDKGLLKLRHHVCPCDQERAGVNGIVRVSYGTPPARGEHV